VAPIDVDDAKIFASNFAEPIIAAAHRKAASASAATSGSGSSESTTGTDDGTTKASGTTGKVKAADYNSTSISVGTQADFSGASNTEKSWLSVSQSTLRAGAAIGLLVGTVAVTKVFT
jgi:hypothetical protein